MSDGYYGSQESQLESRHNLILQQIQTLQQRALELHAEEHSLSAAMVAQQVAHKGRDAVQMPAKPSMYPHDLAIYPPNIAALYSQGAFAEHQTHRSDITALSRLSCTSSPPPVHFVSVEFDPTKIQDSELLVWLLGGIFGISGIG